MSFLSLDDAIRMLRAKPEYADLVRDAYLGRDVRDSGNRFLQSAEFAEVKNLLDNKITGSTVIDLGAGSGIASFAFLESGASRVYALEPDPSDEVGQGAIRRLDPVRIKIAGAYGEALPFPNESIDIVYVRQVLHHTRDLNRVTSECYRVLKQGGVFLACREHVVDDETQLAQFLENHPIHRLAGGENAYHLDDYVNAIKNAGFVLNRLIGPWDSVINAFPSVRSDAQLRSLPRKRLQDKYGLIGFVLSYFPGVDQYLWKRIKHPTPGRMFTFFATK